MREAHDHPPNCCALRSLRRCARLLGGVEREREDHVRREAEPRHGLRLIEHVRRSSCSVERWSREGGQEKAWGRERGCGAAMIGGDAHPRL